MGPTLQKRYFNLGESSKKSCSFLPSNVLQDFNNLINVDVEDEEGCENITLRATSRFFRLVPFVKCWQMFLELVPKGQYRISEKQGSRCLVARPPQEAVV